MCTWCDAAYTWDAGRFDLRAELTRLDVDEIYRQLQATDPKLVIVSGGEPLLQQGEHYGLIPLLSQLVDEGVTIHVETNGTLRPSPSLIEVVSLFVVSPKLGHADMPASRTMNEEALAAFADLAWIGQSALKVVCRNSDDVMSTVLLAEAYRWPRSKCWIMPEGTDAAILVERSRELVGPTLAAGMNLSGRAHILLWGDTRGT